jgi:hypothetical protein
MKYVFSFFTRLGIILSGLVFVFAAEDLFAQATTVKLPTTDSSSSFRVLNNSNNNLLRMNADGGFYFGGIDMTGAIPAAGTGTRLMWYHAKGALRTGHVDGVQWDDANIGNYSVALGLNATASGYASLATGRASIASGPYSAALGDNCTAAASNSTAMGLATAANALCSMAIGGYVKANHSGTFIAGDFSKTTYDSTSANNQMTMRFAGGYRLFTSSACTTGVTLDAGGSSWSTVSDRRKKENFDRADGEYFLKGLARLSLGSWNYIGQDSKTFRHYGPMAQEIFQYYGKDSRGTIGNDTTLAGADVDGIMMICLQALEIRTAELRNAVNELKVENEKTAQLQESLNGLKDEVLRMNSEIRSLTKAKQERAQTRTAVCTTSTE